MPRCGRGENLEVSHALSFEEIVVFGVAKVEDEEFFACAGNGGVDDCVDVFIAVDEMLHFAFVLFSSEVRNNPKNVIRKLHNPFSNSAAIRK